MYSFFYLNLGPTSNFFFQSEKDAIKKATPLLEGSVSNLTDAYALALTTYALVLVDSPEKLKANRRLVEMATFNSGW